MARKKPIISPLGQWAYPGEVTVIPSSNITMKGVNYPVLGIDDLGNQQMMMPGGEYDFPGNYVTEYPQMNKGGQMIKRKDGSYSKRGLWDNIRANKGSGKKPTKEMLEQERKIKAKMQNGGWLDQYQSGGSETSTEQNPERMSPVNINVKRKKVSDNPTYQYDNQGNLLYAPDLNIHPYALDNSTKDNFWVNPKLPIKNLNPTVEELRQVAAPYYPIDNKLVSDLKINLQPSNYQQSLEKDYVLPQAVGKSFGNLPIVKDDGYSPNRRWVSNLRAPNIGSRYSKDYAYVLKTNPDSLVNYSNKKNIENSLSLNNKVFYDYLAKNNYSPDTVDGLTRELPDQIWNRAEQMRIEMRNNPEIMSWANLHNVDLGYKEPGKGDDDFAPKIPESIYASRLAQAGLPTNRPDFDYSPQETYVIQDPSKFDLAGYFPMGSIVNDATQKVLDKEIPGKLKRESVIGKDVFERESYIKDEIAKRMGLDPSAFNNGEYLIHYNQTPITEYTPGKKYGGWLDTYQVGGSMLSMGDYDLTTAPKRGNYLLPDINRPSYIDDAGERRTEYKIGKNIEGKETLIPSVVNGRQLSEDEAVDRYYKTGLHMGQFNTPEEANYAARLRTARYKMLEDPIGFKADEFQVGGVRPPIYTSNPRRVQLYQDSLDLYNKYQPSFDKYKNFTRVNNIQTSSLTGNNLFNQYWGPYKPKGPSPYNENIIIKPVEEMMHQYIRFRPGTNAVTVFNEHRGNNYLETKPTDYLKPNPNNLKRKIYNIPVSGSERDRAIERMNASVANRKKLTWPVSVTKQDFLDLGLTGVTPDLNSVFRFKKPVQPYILTSEIVPEVVETPVVEPPKPSLFVSNIDRDMYTPNGGMAREYNIGVTLQDGSKKAFRTEKEYQDWKTANNLDISNAKVSEGRGYSYNYPENKKYGGWLNKYQTGGWDNWTPNVGKPYMRTSPAGNAGYSDNARVSSPDLNNRKAAEAAQYAKRVGSISQGQTKSAYEKAKEASSLVAQAERRKGSADPLDYVLDMVNPATYAFAGTDLVGNTGSAISNTAQGNFKEAGSDLLNAGLNALYLLPAKGIAKAIASPMAFRPVEGMMYRGLGKEGFKDAVQSGVFRPKQLNYTSGRSLAERATTPKQFSSTYYAPSKKFGVIENYGPDYVAEVPFNEQDFFRRYSKRNDWSYSTPKQIPISEGKILKKDWLLGYKPVDVSSAGQMSITPPVGGHVKNIGKELLGLTRNKGNKAAIAEGNTWLKNWIDDSVTQAKIDTDLGWIPQRGNTLKDKFDLGYEQAKSFRPNTKEYPISNQIQDLGESLFLKNPNEHMHAGNKGISNLYNKSPLERNLIETGNIFDPKYGSFVSRNPSISQNQRALTTTHEGTHDWASDFLLNESGQKQDILNLLSPDTKTLGNQFRKLRNQGVSSKQILKTMGKENAYKGYFADPAETHAKIMEIRKAFNMTPEQSKNLTTSQAKNIMNILDRGENVTNINPTFLDVIDRDPKKLATLFNRLWAVPAVAAASQLQEQKKGGQTSWLNKYK